MALTMRHVALIAATIGVLFATTTVTLAAFMVGTDGNDTLKGSAENDEIYGRGGNDTIDGGAGRDDLDGGPGSDDIRGGAGSDDAVGYDDATGVKVSLDDQPNDGAPGEADNVHSDVEHVYSGSGRDTLTGNGARNTLDAGAGDDRLTGGKGPDGLFGGAGTDVVDGRGGAADVIDCGSGSTDVAVRDAGDNVDRCEFFVRRPPARGSVLAPAKGRFRLGGGVSQARGCRGRVRVELLRREEPIAKATVPVDRKCRYRKTFVLNGDRVGSATQLDFRARFLGNSVQGAGEIPGGRAPIIRID